MSKTSTLILHIEPALKEGLRAAAVQEHRSIANMIAVMIGDFCGRNGVAIPEPDARKSSLGKTATGSSK